MTTVSPDVLRALGRLNTHARAYGFGRHAIYAYKALAVLTLARACELTARQVQWTGRCFNCSGTGKWHDWRTGESKDNCRRCSGRGTVTLQFIETTLPDGQAWHHPFPDCYWLAEASDLCFWSQNEQSTVWRSEIWESAGEWRPLLPAERLSADRGAADLNLVEDWVADRPLTSVYSYIWENAARAITSYALELGRVDTKCSVCGSEDVAIGLGHHRRFLHWSNPVCAAHRDLPLKERPQDIPPAAITPAIEAWLTKRGWKPGEAHA